MGFEGGRGRRPRAARRIGCRAACRGYHPAVTRNRLEAFSDGVIAILITIMVLELTVPTIHDTEHPATLAALWELRPVFLSYVISFVYLAIY